MTMEQADRSWQDRLEHCRVADEGRLRVVTIDRPHVLNALHAPATAELERIWDDFAVRDDLWAAIVTGAGDQAFSVGNDLKAKVAAAPEAGPQRMEFGGLTHRFDLGKPVIAAVSGFAMGGGFELALACDLIVAAENAVFALPEPRVGVVAAAGGVHRLPRMIPHKQAMGMILTGRRVSAREGFAMGFVNEVVPVGQVLAAARRWAAMILECSPLAVRAAKEAVHRGMDEPTLETAMRTTYPGQHRNLASLDYREGPRAFVEKRAPRWQNR